MLVQDDEKPGNEDDEHAAHNELRVHEMHLEWKTDDKGGRENER